jgi:hypothetical protein
MSRPLAILFALYLAIGVLLPSSVRGGLICIGGGCAGVLPDVEASGLERCSHEFGVVSRSDGHHDEHCHCTDLPTAGPAIAVTSRSDEVSLESGIAPPCCAWLPLVDGFDGPSAAMPPAPPWFNPGLDHRMVLVASFRLVL